MPAYNAERTVADTYREIPKYLRKHIILVDDGSRDNTVSVAKKLGIKVFHHSNNLGYGGNQKTCYWEAMKLNPDVVVMLHPDYQYDASMIEDLIAPILKGRYDFMFGSRIANKKAALDGGMPRVKYYVNRLVCFVQNIILGTNFTEQFSGFRAFSRRLLETVPFGRFSNDFVFDQEMTVSALSYGFEIGEIAIPTRYHEKASSIQFFKGSKFVLEGFYTILRRYMNDWGFAKDARFKSVRKRPRNNITALLLLVLLALITLPVVGIANSLIIFVVSVATYAFYLKGNFAAYLFAIVMMLSLLLANGVDRNLLMRGGIDEYQKLTRGQYYTREFGRLYTNRFGFYFFDEVTFYINRINYKVSAPLTLNHYFFAVQRRIYPVWLLPFFLIGVFNFVRKKLKNMLAYIAVAMAFSVVIIPTAGDYLYLPLINFCVTIGVFSLMRQKTKFYK